MKNLTRKEEEIMRHYWANGAMFVRELLALYADPQPHFNTVSTMVRTLESKGYLFHKVYGNTHQYYSIITEEEYAQYTIAGAVSKYLSNSYLSAVSTLIKEEKISVEELKSLIKEIEKS